MAGTASAVTAHHDLWAVWQECNCAICWTSHKSQSFVGHACIYEWLGGCEAHPSCSWWMVSLESPLTLLVRTTRLSNCIPVAAASICCWLICTRFSLCTSRMIPTDPASRRKLLLLKSSTTCAHICHTQKRHPTRMCWRYTMTQQESQRKSNVKGKRQWSK